MSSGNSIRGNSMLKSTVVVVDAEFSVPAGILIQEKLNQSFLSFIGSKEPFLQGVMKTKDIENLNVKEFYVLLVGNSHCISGRVSWN